MIKTGQIKYDNNYWMNNGDGTWSNFHIYYDVIMHGFGAYNVVYVVGAFKDSLVSTDGGKTFDVKEHVIYDNGSNPQMLVNVTNVEEAVENLMASGNKTVTWVKPMVQAE